MFNVEASSTNVQSPTFCIIECAPSRVMISHLHVVLGRPELLLLSVYCTTIGVVAVGGARLRLVTVHPPFVKSIKYTHLQDMEIVSSFESRHDPSVI